MIKLYNTQKTLGRRTGGETNWIENRSCSITGLAAKIHSSEEFRNTRNSMVCSVGSLTKISICQRNYFKMVREIFGVKKLKSKQTSFWINRFYRDSIPVPDQKKCLTRLGLNNSVTTIVFNGLALYEIVHRIAKPNFSRYLKN